MPPAEFPEPRSTPRAEAAPGAAKTDSAELVEYLKTVLEQKQFVTGRISETVRYVGFGLLAVFYAVVSSDSGFSRGIVTSMHPLLTATAIFGVIAVFFDYLQYLAGSIAVDRAIAGGTDTRYQYNRTWPSFIWRRRCYWIKQVAVIIGCMLLIVILLFASSAPSAPPASAIVNIPVD